jgi:hypothetical protein
MFSYALEHKRKRPKQRSLAKTNECTCAQAEPPRPVFDQNGVVHVPAFELPASELMSFRKLRAKMPTNLPFLEPDITKFRKALEAIISYRLWRIGVVLQHSSIHGWSTI